MNCPGFCRTLPQKSNSVVPICDPGKGVFALLERKERAEVDLLDYISGKMNVLYLSDLKYTAQGCKMYDVISKIPESAFTSREWKDAAYYLTGKGNLRDAVEAKAVLLNYYKNWDGSI